MIKLFLITGYNSYTNKTLKRIFRVPSDALQFSLGLTDSKMTVLNGLDYISIFNEYLIKESEAAK